MMTARATTVVIGPLTRAGRAITQRATTRGDEVLLVARHDADISVLADNAAVSGGDVSVLHVDLEVDLLREGDGPLRILVCALGPVHPADVQTDVDSRAFLRDLAFVEKLLVAAWGRPVSVVLISSVIALAPAADRRYYGGWKCLAEQQLAEHVRRLAPHGAFSVVYPGRLVQTPSRGLHTSYPRLAATVDALADGRSRARVSGIDARLWIVAHSLRLLMHSLLPLRSPLSGRPLDQSVSANERYSRP